MGLMLSCQTHVSVHVLEVAKLGCAPLFWVCVNPCVGTCDSGGEFLLGLNEMLVTEAVTQGRFMCAPGGCWALGTCTSDAESMGCR